MISFVAMPTLALTWEHAGDLSGPPLMNVHDFGENFSPSACTRRRSTKPLKEENPGGPQAAGAGTASNFPFPFSLSGLFFFNLYGFRRLWRGVCVICFRFTFTKLRAIPLCVNLRSQIKSLAQGQRASSCRGHHFPFHHGVQTVTSRSKSVLGHLGQDVYFCRHVSLLLYTL